MFVDIGKVNNNKTEKKYVDIGAVTSEADYREQLFKQQISSEIKISPFDKITQMGKDYFQNQQQQEQLRTQIPSVYYDEEYVKQKNNPELFADEYARKATKGDGYENLSFSELENLYNEETKKYEGGETDTGYNYGYKGNIVTRALDFIGNSDKYNADEKLRNEYKKLQDAYENRKAAYTDYMASQKYGTQSAEEAITKLKEQKKSASDEKKKKIDEEIKNIRSGLYGESNALDYAVNAIKSGANTAAYQTAALFDVTLGNISNALGFEDNIFSQTRKDWQNRMNKSTEEYQKSGSYLGDKKAIAGQLLQGATAALPDAIMAIATGGASTASTLGVSSTGLVSSMRSSISAMAKNPFYWTSFGKELGSDYYEALDKGASEGEAMSYALIAATLNSVVEVGGTTGAGGIQTLPEALRNAKGSKSAIWKWVKSAFDEGKEEVVQGVISGLTEKIIYNNEKEIASFVNEDAVINPQRMASEFALGTAVGGILGGGQMVFNNIVNASTASDYKKIGKFVKNNYDVQGIIDYGKTSIDANIRAMAQTATPKNISDTTAGELYAYVARDINSAINSPESIEVVNQNYSDIINKTNSELISGTASSQYIQRLMDMGIDSQYAETMLNSTISEQPKVQTFQQEETQIEEPAGVQTDVISLTEDNRQRKHLNKATQEYVKKIANTFGVNVIFENVESKTGVAADSYYDNQGNIHMDFSVTDPVNVLIKHELTHFGESGNTYNSFVSSVKNSSVFEKWINSKVSGEKSKGAKSAQYRKEIMQRYENAGKTLSVTQADNEMIANFVADTLFTDNGSGIDQLINKATAKEKPILIQWIIDFVRSIKNLFKGNRVPLEVLSLERKYVQMLKDAQSAVSQKNTAENGGVEFSISSAYNISDSGSNVNKRFTKQTETQQFKRWFGDWEKHPEKIEPVLLNENGEPKVYYHGTNESFNTFSPEELAPREGSFFFAENREDAEAYGKNVFEVYLTGKKFADYDNQPSEFYRLKDKRAQVEWLKQKGYDGWYADMDSGGWGEVSVFSPEQIKSATDNIGTFDASNPDIRFSIPEDQASLLDRYENGEISRQEYLEKSNENWQKAAEKYGTIPEGEKAAEKIPIVSAVEDGKKTRRFVRSVIEKGALSKRMIEDVGSEILVGNMSYEPVSDKSSLQYADKHINSGSAEQKWNDTVNKKHLITKNDIAVGEKLLIKAIEEHDTKRVLELTAELSDIFTRAGQTVQAARMFKNMTGIGKLVAAQKYVNSLNNDLEQKYGKKAPVLKIDETLAEQLAMIPAGENPQSIYTEVMKDIASQVPAIFLEKLNAYRYLSMLLNPKTHIRNIVGNGIFIPSVRMKDFFATGIENLIIKNGEKTKSIKIDKKYKDFADKMLKDDLIKQSLKEGRKTDELKLAEYRRIFKTEFLEKARQLNFGAFEAEDFFFKTRHFRHALAGYLQANKVDLNNIDQKLLDRATEYAIKEAAKATFNDASELANAISRFAGKNRATDIMINGILPFKRTPINIVKRGVEYSPIGLIATAIKGSIDLKKGRITASEYADGLGAGISGSIVFAMGALLASLGLASGSFGDDDEDKFKRLNGEQEYSLIFDGKSYTIDWAVPAAIPFFIGVETFNSITKDNDDFSLSDITEVMWNLLEPITNLSMLSGVQDMISSVKYAAENRSIQSIAEAAVSSYISQFVPSVFGAISRTVDDTRYSSYTDKNSQLSSFTQGIINSIKSKLPNFIAKRPAYVDEWGRTESTGSVIERMFSNFISPGYFSEEQYTALDNEIQRLANSTGENSVYPGYAPKSFKVNGETKYLTADEYQKYATAKGQYSLNYISEFMSGNLYNRLDDDERVNVIENLYKYANKKAKSEVSDYDISDDKAYLIEKSGNSVVTYYATLAIKNSKSKE